MKHAYLIMAHGNFEQLQFLVHLLDCEQNDIFIHIDKKTEICDLSLKTKYSAVTIFQKYKIYWGHIHKWSVNCFCLGKQFRVVMIIIICFLEQICH